VSEMRKGLAERLYDALGDRPDAPAIVSAILPEVRAYARETAATELWLLMAYARDAKHRPRWRDMEAMFRERAEELDAEAALILGKGTRP
jgi:hypothetical protein